MTEGLKFHELSAWQRWQDSRRRLHVVKAHLTRSLLPPGSDPGMRWWLRGTSPEVLVVCDSDSPTSRHSLIAPLLSAPDLSALVLHPQNVELGLSADWTLLQGELAALDGVSRVASIGNHLPLGAWAAREAHARGWHQLVVQHGLLTPFSPPPPPHSRVLTWTAADADFLRAGRPDLVLEVVGSPLLAAAAATSIGVTTDVPVFLGQLHGAELPRWSMAYSTTHFWRMTGARYRPHPRENDALSHIQHRVWRRLGMEFDITPTLPALDQPVVAAFSTGILEAAARGIPAWAFQLNPPRWLEEFWDRYSMSQWGQSPTPAPLFGDCPSREIAARFSLDPLMGYGPFGPERGSGS